VWAQKVDVQHLIYWQGQRVCDALFFFVFLVDGFSSLPISYRVDMSVNKHLRIQLTSNIHTFCSFDSEAQTTFVAFHLALTNVAKNSQFHKGMGKI
jgi:hypothetical protein